MQKRRGSASVMKDQSPSGFEGTAKHSDVVTESKLQDDGDGLPLKDTMSMGLLDSENFNADPLVKFGVDMTELSDYLDNIITVVN